METNIKAYSEQLKQLGIEHTVVEHPSLKTPPETLGHLGLSLADGVSTLVLKCDDDFIALLRRDDRQVDFKKIKKLVGAKNLRMASPEEFVQVTGLPVGAARVYIPEVSKTFIDSQVLEKAALIGGSGSFTYSIKYKTADLVKIPRSSTIDITSKQIDGKKRVLSGIRSTGRLHLGNYLGAVKGMLALQDNPEYETFYMVADLHAVTTPYKVEELRKNRREIIIDYLAAGLDPKKSVLFQQAESPHAELAFYFSSVVTIAKMQHLPTFKDKVKQHPEAATMALLNYPILMAADILIYKAGLVPVGLDQEPHLEVSREIARRMNQDFHTNFPEPQRFKTAGEYVPSLTGEGKMGKSIEGSYINLVDDLPTIQAKLAKVPTDDGKGYIAQGTYISHNAVKKGTSSGGVKTLLTLVDLYQGSEVRDAYEEAYQGTGLRYGDLKNQLAQAIADDLKPMQEKRAHFEAHPEEVDAIIEEGNAKAAAVATETVKEVREKMGLL